MFRGELLGLYCDRVLPMIVLLGAIFLRFHSLDTVPRGLLWDEAYNGLDALRVLKGERPIFFTVNFGREAIFIYLQAISVTLLGHTTLALRAVSAVLGILTVAAAYPLARSMFNSRVALLTCGWLSLSIWHVIFSRMGFRTISLPLFLAVGFYCLWRGLQQADSGNAAQLPTTANRSKPAIWFALGGVVIGLSLYTYPTARFAPLVIVALALYLAVLHRDLFRRSLPGLGLALAMTALVFLPQGLFFLSHPESFVERAQEVTIANPALREGNPGKVIFDSALRSLGMFAIRGDGGWEKNISGRPVFDPFSAALMLAGIALAVRQFRKPQYGFILIWLVVMFVPSILAVDGTPSFLRATAIIPAVFILPALGAAWLWRAWDSRVPARLNTLPILLVTIAFIGGMFHAYHSCFGIWARMTDLAPIFSADRIATFQTAFRLVRTEHTSILMSGGEHYDPRDPFILSGQPEAQFIRTFDAERSIIFPATPADASYLLTWVQPHAPLLGKYFDQASTRVVDTAPSGRPITLRRLVRPLPPFEPEWPVSARFGEQVFVYGFDLPKDARADGTMTVRWYWRLLVADEREFSFTNQLFGADGHRRGQFDDGGFAPGYWPVGTSGITTFVIDIDPDTPTGAYWLRVAMYDRGRTDISNLPVFDTQGNQAGNQLKLGPIKIHGRPSAQASEGPVSSSSLPDNLLPASFTDQIDLLGYNLSDRHLVSGESLDLTLYWSPRGRPTHDYTVFVHLLDSSGQLRGQADSPPMAGEYPTSVWDAGEVIADLHTLSLAPDLPAGEYKIAIGLYDPETGQRVPIVDQDGQVSGDHVIISGLAVEE